MFERATADELGLAMGQLHGLSVASLAQLLRVIAEYDRRGAYAQDGASCMVEWLKLRFAVSGETAARWVRVARRLEHLPAIAAAFSEGSLSFDQVRVVVGFATPETDASLAERAAGLSVPELLRLAREGRAVDTPEQHRRRYLSLVEDDDLAMMRVRGLLPMLEGKALRARLVEEAAEAPPDPVVGCLEPLGARMADALLNLVLAEVPEEASRRRPFLLVQADNHAITTDDGWSLDGQTLRRLSCGCRFQLLHRNELGVVTVGRERRLPAPWQERLVRLRDQGCRICGRRRFTQIHHLISWFDGGVTDLHNLLELCWFHHHLVHKAGWSITGHPDGEVTLVTPWGKAVAKGPPPLRADIRQRMLGEVA